MQAERGLFVSVESRPAVSVLARRVLFPFAVQFLESFHDAFAKLAPVPGTVETLKI